MKCKEDYECRELGRMRCRELEGYNCRGLKRECLAYFNNNKKGEARSEGIDERLLIALDCYKVNPVLDGILIQNQLPKIFGGKNGEL